MGIARQAFAYSTFARRRLLLVGALVALPACNPFSPKTCTVVGCAPSFVVRVLGAPADAPVTVTVTAPDGASRTGACHGAGTTCTAYLDGFTPPAATIRVSWNTQIAEFVVQPTYTTTYPNGRDCPPECVGTQVAVNITQ